MASSMYQNSGPGRPPPPPPPGTYRQNNNPQNLPPPPPPGQYSSYNYQQGSSFTPAQSSPSGQQMGYNSNYGYPAQGGSYGPPGVNSSQSQYPRPPLPSYSLQSPPPPPPPPLSGAPPLPPQPPPPAPLPPPPPPPIHGGAPPYASSSNSNTSSNVSNSNQAYQEVSHSQYYPSNVPPHQLPPPPPLPSNYSSSSLGNVTSTQLSSAGANPSRQATFKSTSGYLPPSKQGNIGMHEKAPPKVAKLPPPGMAPKGENRPDMDRERKKREYERKKMEDKKEVKMSTSTVIHKFPAVGTPLAKQSSVMVSRDGRADLRKEKFDNRLKRPSTFVCKIKFRNELPDPISQPKLLQVNNDRDRYCKYSITSLERTQKHRLLVDADLGIPLDLLDISVYNPPKVRPPMDPEDEELLRDDEKLPSARTEIIRKKDRPTDKGVAWLVKTQYISPISLDPAKQALTEKQAKELKEMRDGKKDMLENLNDREQQIRSIQESFRVAQQTPVHQSKPSLKPIEVLPLLPDFKRWESKYMHMTFDGEPTADSELHSKLDRAVREELEGLGILKTFNFSDPETGKQERFLAYMVPKVEELNADTYEEMTYTWVREYHSEARPEETQHFSTYVFSLGDGVARYLPLRQKISLQKKKSKERSKEEGENAFAIPSRVTIRREEVEQEAEETAARRLALTNDFQNARSSKRRQSDGGGFSAGSKHRPQSKKRAMSDDEDAYISS